MLIEHTIDPFLEWLFVQTLARHLVHRTGQSRCQPNNCMHCRWIRVRQSILWRKRTEVCFLHWQPNSLKYLHEESFLRRRKLKCTLNDASGVEPGCVEIIPLNRGTRHVRTWLYSLHTDIKNSSDSLTFVTGLWCTVNVWNNCGLWPTVSGCWTITRTLPDRVP